MADDVHARPVAEEPAPGTSGAGSRWARLRAELEDAGERGMATAEYAIATVAAAGFAGLLLVILRSAEVREAVTALIRQALSM